MLPLMPSQPDKARAEAAVLGAARGWYADVDLNYQGVNLGDALTYDVQQIFGRLWARYFMGQEQANGNASTNA